MTEDILLSVVGLRVHFPVLRGLLRRKVAEVKAVDGITFSIKRGETLGLVGESGCGKTTAGRCISRLIRPTEGQIWFEGREISDWPLRRIRSLRRKISLVFQDPYSSLDPRQSAGSIVGEPLLVHNLVRNRTEYRQRVAGLFSLVGLDPSMTDRVPHEFSGGQRQRLAIARALAGEPSLVICDEPISALDVSIQAQIINLFQKLQSGLEGLTYLFIAHDLAVVRHISTRIAVMYLGRIVEIVDQETLYENPLHPYTKALLSAVPEADPVVERSRKRVILAGEVPSPLNPPQGCHFHPRCPVSVADCEQSAPPLCDVGSGHQVACHLV